MFIAVQLTNVGFVTQLRTFDLYNSVTDLSPCVLLGKKTSGKGWIKIRISAKSSAILR